MVVERSAARPRPQKAKAAVPSPVSAGDAGSERLRALESERQSLAVILDLLRTGRASTRLDLEREARLGRAVVTDRIATLTAFGFIDESGLGRSIGGRAPRLLRFRPDAGRLLVANLDRDTIGVGLADIQGRLILEHFEDVEVGASPDTLFDRLDALFGWCLGQDDSPPLWGMGLGLPEPVETGEKVVQATGWSASGVTERLMQRFKAPVWVRSAVQLETMGESGALDLAQGRNMLFVSLGREISAGFLSAGRLHHGASGVAGQIGHTYAGDGHTVVCGCGNIGCLETVAGCDAIAREATSAAEEGRSRVLAELRERNGLVTIADIGTAARLGDPFAADLLARSGRLIGTVLATVINLLNPSTVVVGGELAQTGDICIAGIREGVYRHAQPLVTRDLGIGRSRMGRSSGLVGAATVSVQEIFAPTFLEAWITLGTPLAHPAVVALLDGTRRPRPAQDAVPPPPVGVASRGAARR